MKTAKKLIAVALILVMVLSFSACHKKGETAVTVDGVKFTSAYYMCALVNNYSQAKSKVDEQIAAEKKEDGTSSDAAAQQQTESTDYFKQKIDGKKFEKWITDETMTALKKIAAYKNICKKNNVEPEEDVINNAETYAKYYWTSYGYSAFFEPNGVGEETYTQYMKDSYYAELCFKTLYGEGGEKELKADEVKEKLNANYLLADVIDAAYNEEMTDAQKTELETKLNGYVSDLKNGTKTFDQVYNDYNEITEEQAEEAPEDGETAPINKHATILGSADTDYASDDFDTVKAMAKDEVKLVKSDSGLKLIVKRDLNADKYYYDNADTMARHMIGDEDFDKYIEDYMKNMKVEKNDYAVNQFKVKKIVEPSNGQ